MQTYFSLFFMGGCLGVAFRETVLSELSFIITALTSDLIDGEADGVHVLSLPAKAAAILLHQSHQEAAGSLVIVGVVVLLQ